MFKIFQWFVLHLNLNGIDLSKLFFKCMSSKHSAKPNIETQDTTENQIIFDS